MNDEQMKSIDIGNGNSLSHYGVKHKSGRYPWGSGDNPFQHDPNYKGPDFEGKSAEDFYNHVEKMKKDGLPETKIAEAVGLTTTELRAYKLAASLKVRDEQRAIAVKMRNDGATLREITDHLGYSNDSSIRQLLNDETTSRRNEVFDIAKMLKEEIDKHGPTDVGEGVELGLGCTRTKLDQALTILNAEYGYSVEGVGVKQRLNPGQNTTMMVAGPKGMTQKDLQHIGDPNWDGLKIPRVNTVVKYAVDDNGNPDIKPAFGKPASVARNRVGVLYKEDGGTDMDGVIEVRPGVADLSLGQARYSQVRIAVDDTEGNPSYYLKGMCIYGDPKDFDKFGKDCDIIVHSNKSNKKTDAEVFKPLKKKDNGEVDWEDPFGSAIKPLNKGGQYYYKDKNGVEKIGAINKRADEGDWDKWSDRVPAQFLSKQPPKTIKKQLDYTIADKRAQLEEIMKLTNPAVRHEILKDFAGSCDTQARGLYAAAFPRQKYQVILPATTLKDNEVYAPNYTPGEKVALIRFPHAGTFEIPILTVNNNNEECLNRYSNQSMDIAVINPNVAGRLSGADFDGDTVMVIPLSDKVNVKSTNPLPGMKEFTDNFHDIYAPIYKEDENGNKVMVSKTLTKKTVQKAMGEISNLITDMTLSGASMEEITRAVKQSMIVIDCPKHKLNYLQSEVDLGIKELKEKYQKHDFVDPMGKEHKDSTAAATIISRSKGETTVYKHRGSARINPETGEYYYPDDKLDTYKEKVKLKDEKGRVQKDEEGRPIYVETGNIAVKKEKSSWMDAVADAKELVRDPNNEVEMAYAEYANALKALANEARKEMVTGPKLVYSPEAYKKYANEVAQLNADLNESLKNKPKERQAQLLLNLYWNRYVESHGGDESAIEKDEAKKIQTKMLNKAREEVGAKRYEIEISDKEWEAIQAGAISQDKLLKIFGKSNQERFYQLAMPKEELILTPAKENKMKTMYSSGYSTSDIAKSCGISESYVREFIEKQMKGSDK